MIEITAHGATRKAPAPTLYEATLNTQLKSGERNALGRLMREPLPDKWSLNTEWEFGTPEEFYEWFNYLRGLTQIDFGMRFAAPTGRMETATFYISPISAKMLNLSRGNTGWWRNMKCTFVEV